MLKTERNTPTMGARVLRAFQKWARANGRSTRRTVTVAGGRIETRARYNADFEHGQWWITDLDTGDQWAVNDAEGSEANGENGVFDGFCFEQVTKGDD
jgi:hypothetical protein